MDRLNVYVIHSDSLTFRKGNIDRLLEKLEKQFQVNATFITQHEPAEINRDTLLGTVAVTTPPDLPENSPLKGHMNTLHIRQVSNLMKHTAALEMIANASPTETHLILEDDVAYPENVATQLSKLLESSSYSIMFLGLPATKEWQAHEQMKQPFVFENFTILPCIDSYVITPEIADKLVKTMRPFYYPTHFQLTYCLSKLGVDTKFSIPNVFADGSKLGIFTSLLNTNNKLVLNSDYNDVLSIARLPEISQAKYAEAYAILERASGIKDHPDMAYLVSVIELKHGNHKKAHEMMSVIYQVYKSNGAILNHESEFLRVFIDTHKYIQ